MDVVANGVMNGLYFCLVFADDYNEETICNCFLDSNSICEREREREREEKERERERHLRLFIESRNVHGLPLPTFPFPPKNDANNRCHN